LILADAFPVRSPFAVNPADRRHLHTIGRHTGRGHGVTNIVALDRSSAVLEQKTIQVEGARA
jgi:hypothetical protein